MLISKGKTDVALLKEIAEFLNEETEVEQLLDGALRLFLSGTNFEAGWIFLIDETGKHRLSAAQNLPPALAEQDCHSLKNGGCWCVSKYSKQELRKASNIIECQRIENVLKAKKEGHGGITHHATVPLQSGQERFGLLNVAYPNTSSYSENELALLESVAFQIGSAIKRITLTKKEQELLLLQERNRLAKDLHDSVNQLLFSVVLNARGGYEIADNKIAKNTFIEIQELAQNALNEMRALIWQLRPKGLENGIIEGILGYAEVLGLELNVQINGICHIPSRIEEALFRIVQEALNNVRKHSGVTTVDLYMTTTSSDVLVIVKDEGSGFSIESALQLPSIGLQSMKERAENTGGSIEWISGHGKGTEILVRIPY